MSKYIRGVVYKNYRARPGDDGTMKTSKDPQMCGFISFPNGRATVAVWMDLKSDEDTIMKMTLRPENSKKKIYSFGEMKINNIQRAKTAPQFLGDVIWSGKTYSVAGWLNAPDKKGNPYIKITLQLIADETKEKFDYSELAR